MSDNIINIDERRRNRTTPNSPDPTANEKILRAKDLLRLREIEKEVREGKSQRGGQTRFNDVNDRMIAGLELGTLKNKLQQKGFSVEKIKEGFPHIHRYQIDPDKSPKEAAKDQAAGMVKMVRNYLFAAEAMAKLADLDADDWKIRVLKNTSIWRRSSSNIDGEPAEPNEAANAVALLFHQLSARVIRKTQLDKLFGRMQRVPGRWAPNSSWDTCNNCFGQGSGRLFDSTAYQDWIAMSGDAPPLPSVPLVELWHCGISFAGEMISVDDGATEESPPVAADRESRVVIELHVLREIRLALGPTTSLGAVGPLFESHGQLVMRFRNASTSEWRNAQKVEITSDELGDYVKLGQTFDVMIDGLRHRVTSLGQEQPILRKKYDPFSNRVFDEFRHRHDRGSEGIAHVDEMLWFDARPLDRERWPYSWWDLSWNAVDAAHVGHWLDRYGEFAPGGSFSAVRDTWFPYGVLGHWIENAIAGGQMLTALESSVERIRTAFDQHETEWRERMQERDAALIAEWESDLCASSLQIKSEDSSDD